MSGAPLYRSRRKGISLTPLIDVVFILLMFFMMTSTFTRWKAVYLRFPVAGPDVDPKNPQAVMLHADGSLSLRGWPLSLPDAGVPAADAPPALDPARPLVVFPEADTRVQTMLTALLPANVGADVGPDPPHRSRRI